MDDARIKDVSALLSAFFNEESLRKGERYSNYFSSWPAFVGARIAAHSRVVDVDKCILVVEAEHPGWIQLLQLRQSSIVEAVNKRFPELGLRGIVFRVAGQGPPSSPPSAQATIGAESKPEPEAFESRADTLRAIDEIEDPELRTRLLELKKAMQGGRVDH
jgi:hypothetical protein